MNFKKIITPIYIFVLLVHCALLWIEAIELAKITKVVLMPLLIVYLADSLKIFPKVENTNKTYRPKLSRPLILFAFIASWSGDVFLLFEGNLFFIAGMLSFMIAHFCYIFLFRNIQPLKINKAFIPITGGIVVLVIGAIIINHLAPQLGDLYVPVLVYMIVIASMFSSALMVACNAGTKQIGVNYFVPGAALFVLSDSVLSLNIFAYRDIFLGVIVMLTYGFAQLMLAKGFKNYLLK